jgi:alkylation response protein AidB-like acyl-CoA dehydrogenase
MTPVEKSEGITELYAAVDAVAPELEATAREAEELRSAPKALADALRRARIPMSKVPRELGGYELSPAEQIGFFARVAYLNPTAGWLAFNQSGALGALGAALGDDGIERLFAQDSPLVAAVSAPTGRSSRVGGGVRVRGRWAYASGVEVSDWTMLMTICDEPAGPLGVIVPSAELELHDDWHVAALQGSGSVDVTLEDHFVPESLTLNPFAPVRGGKQYSALGYKVYVAGENFGFSLGVAQRLVDEVAKLARGKRRLLDAKTVGDRGALQIELGRCDLALRSNRALMESELEGAMEIAESCDGPIPDRDRIRVEGALAHATESLVQAATRLFPFAGASALHLGSPIQRSLRDLIGSGQHYVSSNQQIEDWGRSLLDSAGGEA